MFLFCSNLTLPATSWSASTVSSIRHYTDNHRPTLQFHRYHHRMLCSSQRSAASDVQGSHPSCCRRLAKTSSNPCPSGCRSGCCKLSTLCSSTAITISSFGGLFLHEFEIILALLWDDTLLSLSLLRNNCSNQFGQIGSGISDGNTTFFFASLSSTMLSLPLPLSLSVQSPLYCKRHYFLRTSE